MTATRRPDLRGLLAGCMPRVSSSRWPGHEHMRELGCDEPSLLLGPHARPARLPESDFGPFVSVWHRAPDGRWSMHVDGPRPDTACPRYFGPALAHAEIEWTGPAPAVLAVERERAVPARVAERCQRPSALEHVETAPACGRARDDRPSAARDGRRPPLRHPPRRPAPHDDAAADLPDRRLVRVFCRRGPGRTNQARGGTASGRARLPARPTLAIGQAHMTINDAAAYEQLRAELPALYRAGG